MTCIHILDQEEKGKLFRKMYVPPSVRTCAKVMYTNTPERIKIIERFLFCLKGVYWESKLPKFRRFTKLEPNEIFNDFAISREPFDEID